MRIWVYGVKNKAFFPVVKQVAAVALGNFINALTVTLFLVPADLVTGGSTGLALSVNYLWGIPISLFVLLFNVVMLLIGWIFLGRSFAVNTLASTFLYPAFLEICQQLFGTLVLTQDILLCTVFSGLGIGIALGIVIRAGASTGGMDIPPLVLHKFCHIPVAAGIYGFDLAILLLQALFRPAENILYGVLLVLIYSVVLDKMLILGQSKTELKIISKRSREICEAILQQLDRGVTLLKGEGGYLHNETQFILTVISNRELYKMEKIVRKIDPECFMIVSRISEVRGRGFSMQK